MDAQELEIKLRGYRLERWKVILSILTPLVLIALTFVVNNSLQERSELLKRQEQILAEKQKIYGELGDKLNVIFVYVADVGDYSHYTPLEVVEKKREADRLFFVYRPYWSSDTECKYDAFMRGAFDMYTGAGLPAKIKTSEGQKKAAYEHQNIPWPESWNQFFSENTEPDISAKYYSAVRSFLADSVSAVIRSEKDLEAKATCP